MNKQSLHGKIQSPAFHVHVSYAALSTHGNRWQTAHDEGLNRLPENNETNIFENGLLDMRHLDSFLVLLHAS